MPNPSLENAGAETQAAIQSGVVIPNATQQPAVASEVANSIPSNQSQAPISLNNTGMSQSSETNNMEGEDIFSALAKLSNFAKINSIQLSSGNNSKIDCFFVDKSVMTNEAAIHFSYAQEVKSFSITKSVTQYGTTGTLDLIDLNGTLSYILEKQNTFYCVINIFEVTESRNDLEKATSMESGYMYQPYVFEIEDVRIMSPDGAKSKIYRLELLDIISSTLKKVSYGNLLLQYPSFINAADFGEIYSTLIDFAALIININHNKKYKIDNRINFIDDITDNINEIIKNVVLKDFPITDNVYKLLNLIYQCACREMEPPASFKGDKPGNILIPILLQDEIEDISGYYRQYFNRDLDFQVEEPITFTDKHYSVSGSMIRRGFYSKILTMPFELAFKLGQKSIIYESINPKKTPLENALFESMNGFSFQPVKDSTELPPVQGFTGMAWKNLALLSDTTGGANNMLVYFNWIYEYYKSAFLCEGENVITKICKKEIVPNLDPHFHIVEQNADDTSEEFAKINSTTIRLKSNDSVKEALYHVGKTLKSFVFMNSLFGFKLKGNMFRHPGEIIKIGNEESNLQNENPTSSLGGINALENGYVLAYMTHISHLYNGSIAEDVIYATKICDIN